MQAAKLSKGKNAVEIKECIWRVLLKILLVKTNVFLATHSNSYKQKASTFDVDCTGPFRSHAVECGGFLSRQKVRPLGISFKVKPIPKPPFSFLARFEWLYLSRGVERSVISSHRVVLHSVARFSVRCLGPFTKDVRSFFRDF